MSVWDGEGARCPPDRVGEVFIRSGSVARGYFHSDEATARTFQARIAGEPDTAYLRSGDLGLRVNVQTRYDHGFDGQVMTAQAVEPSVAL